MAGGADYLLLETCQDTRNVKAGADRHRAAPSPQAGWQMPVAVSATIETMGTMLAGQDVEALAVSLLHADLLYVGLNCATGPEFMTDHLRTLSEICRTRVACVPNAGLPDEDGHYNEAPDDPRARASAASSTRAGSTWSAAAAAPPPAHIAALARAGRGAARRARVPHHRARLVSGLEAVELDRRQPAGARGRAHQRARQPQVQGADRGRASSRTAAEIGRAQVQRRRAGPRRLPRRTPTATRSRDIEALPRPARSGRSRCR